MARTPRNIAQQLAKKYNVEVRQQRYREDGKWYHHLEEFPSAFFDKSGYIVFNTKHEYDNCSLLDLKKDVNVEKNGISSIPGYVRFQNIKDSKEKNWEIEEGAIGEISMELKKRNPELKNQAIKKFGTKCQVCGFDFFTYYGDIGKGYIELHHKLPLSDSTGSRKVALEDVSVVCSNCHRMLHRNGKKPMSILELKQFIDSTN